MNPPSLQAPSSRSGPPVVSVVTHSPNGHTAAMGKAVALGASSVGGVVVHEHAILGTDIHEGRWLNEEILSDLDASHAIIIGSPTFMGCVSSQLKSFMDTTSERYLRRRWVDKVGAAFTVSGLPAGDKGNMLTTCATFALQHGMIWVGVAQSPVSGEGINRLGFFAGAAGQALFEPPTETPNAEDRLTAECLGRRVAEITLRLYGPRS
ncbi:flavodoxin family protein [Luteolibacter yonseiensis]|uniref:Flavodoxin family protein n=1 Tax=Luteolibacter yonseiensis TaxID=1144680 RepID=A0A934R8N0_9BACT|nr:flavodoxin family protein [Luteolibacter yonseiensis]MBK1817240.1 flavodoxin family protein [Luteolibacter yonseiensis]